MAMKTINTVTRYADAQDEDNVAVTTAFAS
jgi:hypothetical protein